MGEDMPEKITEPEKKNVLALFAKYLKEIETMKKADALYKIKGR